MNSWFFFF